MAERVIVALASPRPAATLEDGLARVDRLIGDAAVKGASIVCFPEAYLPGLRGQDFEPIPWDPAAEARAMKAVSALARARSISVIMGLEHVAPAGRQIVAVVFDFDGSVQGFQSKTQLDPSEDQFYVPGEGRRLFVVNGVKFGVAICHEGWRYPETVRWAAVRGAQIVFHPQHTGSEKSGIVLTTWNAADSPYYEQAMMMRSRENTIWFASVNYALKFQEAATSLIAPSGDCQAFLPYGEEGVLVQEIEVAGATGLLAKRYAPERYGEQGTGR